MTTYLTSDVNEELAKAVFTMVFEAPSGDFSDALASMEKISGVNGITITGSINSSTHYLYLAEADYMDDAPKFLSVGRSTYADSWATPNKPLVIFFDGGGAGRGLRLYSTLSDTGKRTLLGEAGNADWEDYNL